MFVKLCYLQLQQDYILGYYRVESDVAAQLYALQILAKIGPVSTLPSHSNWSLDQVLPRKISMTRAACDWELDINSQPHSLGHLSKNNAMQQFLGILKALPDGNSVFFNVRMIDDPIGLLPERVTLGINKKADLLVVNIKEISANCKKNYVRSKNNKRKCRKNWIELGYCTMKKMRH